MKLFLFSLCAVASTQLVAQSLKDTTTLDEVVITENRFQSDLKKTPQTITQIDSKQIEALPARSFAEALAFVPGVDLRQRGVLGTQADIGLRGGSFEQTLLLINGMKITDPQTGHHTMNLPLPFFSVQQMDVLKGPAARIYGQNAFSGAINVITNLPLQKQVKAQVFGGDYNLFGANVFVAMPYKKLLQSLSASVAQNGDYRYNSDAKQGSVLYESQLQINTHNSIRGIVAASTRSMGANGFYSDKYPDQWEATSTLFAGLTYSRSAELSNFQVRTYYRLNNDEFRLKREQPSFYTNTHQSRVFAIESNGSTRSKFGKTGYGVDLRREAITSSNLGTHQRDLLGLYLEHKVQVAGLVARAGVYGNYYNQFGFHYFPGAELGYQLKRSHFIYSNWGFSYRVPTYTELYYKDPVTSSNPNLLPEKAQSIELGYRYNSGHFRTELNVFNRITKNLIDYVKASDELSTNANLWTPLNVSAVNFMGVELASSYHFSVHDSSFSLMSISASYNFVDAKVNSNPLLLSRYALNQLRQQAIIGAQFIVFKKASLTLKARYIERQNLAAYMLFDAKANYKIATKFDVFVECTNITNVHYIETGWVQMPGRWARAGITFNL